MNETLSNIRNRRSTRVFLPTQIKDEELKAILDAGIYAPSAVNQQPWHFTVVQNKELLDELHAKFMEVAKKSENDYVRKVGYNENFHVFYNAPTVVLVSGLEANNNSPVDCAAAVENMLIASESLDIGACWVGFIAYLLNSEEGKELFEKLEIPKGFKQIHSVCIGYKKNKSNNGPLRKENTVNYIK